MKILNLQQMEMVEGGAEQPKGVKGILDCIDGVYTGMGWFSLGMVAASLAWPAVGAAVIGGCIPAMK